VRFNGMPRFNPISQVKMIFRTLLLCHAADQFTGLSVSGQICAAADGPRQPDGSPTNRNPVQPDGPRQPRTHTHPHTHTHTHGSPTNRNLSQLSERLAAIELRIGVSPTVGEDPVAANVTVANDTMLTDMYNRLILWIFEVIEETLTLLAKAFAECVVKWFGRQFGLVD